MQKQAKDIKENLKVKGDPSSPKYLLGVPTSEPMFFKTGSGKQSNQSSPSASKSPGNPGKLHLMIIPRFEEEWGILFYFFLSVHNQYFLSHFSQQPCVTATSDLPWCFGWGSYTLLREFRSARYLLPVLGLVYFQT